MTGLAGALVLLGAMGAGAALAALYLFGLALAALARRRHAGRERAAPWSVRRVVVLVPAHDEADLVTRCIRSLRAQSYPSALFDVVVVADNCTDGTAAIASAAGAQVLERSDGERIGKGYALRWAMDTVLAARLDVDAIVVVDADSVAEPEMLAELVRACTRGVEAVQGEYLALTDADDVRSRLRSAAFLLSHRVRFSGRAALGLPCSLVGNGMLFTRSLLERHPWDAFTGAEDLEYAVDLRLAGVRPAFAPAARLRAPVAVSGNGARTQRQRWEGGRAHVVRTRLPSVVRRVLRGDAGLVDLAVDLAVPPLGLLATAIVLGGLASMACAAGGAPTGVLVPWAVAATALAGFVLVGLVAASAPAATYLALVAAPWIVATDTVHRVGLLRRGRSTTWERTERPGDRLAAGAAGVDRGRLPHEGGAGVERAVVGGVPIDAVDMDAAVERVMSLARNEGCAQVCTVNLDFVVNARRNAEVRSILCGSDLNIADGAPVVWLGRLTGRRMPMRVTGSDLVPGICAAATREGVSVFLLGGERGAAVAAAHELRARHPTLRIAGVLEPSRAALDAMDDDAILERLDAARPDILLVALGHPKQEQWIHRHRDRLPARVAIGVGCTFDLLGGVHRRAPTWMQHAGLEWSYRLVQEPRRLARRYALDFVWLMTVLVPTTLGRRMLARR